MVSSKFGFLNINKAAGQTSHDVVARARRLLKVKQIGHAGTLDPAATGVLPLGVGSACRLLRFLPHDKVYLAEILLGQTTSTDDTQGETLTTNRAQVPPTLDDQFLARLHLFKGEIDQIPPMVSAIHIGGERLYKLAREGRAPEEVPSRKVVIHNLEVIHYQAPLLTIRVHCSGGTYIRSIARDLGSGLGCGGCLASLKRERAGRFALDESIQIDSFNDADSVPLVRPEEALSLPAVSVDENAVDKLRKGQKYALAEDQSPLANVRLDSNLRSNSGNDSAQIVFLMALAEGDLVAICRLEEGMMVPEVVLNR